MPVQRAQLRQRETFWKAFTRVRILSAFHDQQPCCPACSMPTLPLVTFQYSLKSKASEREYVVCARRASDGTVSLLLYEGDGAGDMSETPPLMLISDQTGDRLSARVMDSQQNARSLAQSLVQELLDGVEDLENSVLNALVESLSAWVVENRSRNERGL